MTISGIIPPLATPLQDRDSLDLPGMERLIQRQVDAGIHGLFVLGTTGEGPGLSQKLRRDVIAESARLCGDVPLYVGITDTSLVDAIRLAQVAADHGAAAVVAAPPFYFPAGQTELRHWFTELADGVPLPLLLYNMPSCTHIDIEQESLTALIDHPNIIGLKDSSGDLNYLGQAVQLASNKRPGWPVLVGPEALLIEAMKLGAVGGVTGGANLVPSLFTSLYSAIIAADEREASRLQSIVVELQQLYGFGKYGSSYLKGLKCALELAGLCSGRLAVPYDAFKAPERERVQTWLNDFAQHGLLQGHRP